MSTSNSNEEVKNQGFWVATYTININVWNLADNQVVYSSGDKVAKNMARQKHRLTSDQAMYKWNEAYADVYQQLQQLEQVRVLHDD